MPTELTLEVASPNVELGLSASTWIGINSSEFRAMHLLAFPQKTLRPRVRAKYARRIKSPTLPFPPAWCSEHRAMRKTTSILGRALPGSELTEPGCLLRDALHWKRLDFQLQIIQSRSWIHS